jgi:LemA protein
MTDIEKIQQLQDQGKINPEQAALLLAAVKESEERKEIIFCQVATKKQERQNKAWGFVSIWFVVILLSMSVLLYTFKTPVVNRDVSKALRNFNEASIYLGEIKYQKAMEVIKKGIEKAPDLSIGYSLLGTAYLGFLEMTGEANYRQEAHRAFNEAKTKALLEKEGGKMNGTATLFLVIFMILVVSLIGLLFSVLYNLLIKREERVNESWAQIGTLLRRKTDLIPALLEVVKNYSGHEQNTLQGVINARNNAEKHSEKIAGIAESDENKLKDIETAYNALGAGIGTISGLAEQYPDLKADIHYKTMQEELRNTEDQLTFVRQRYNRAVRSYNASLKIFPYNLMAKMFDFQPKVYFSEEK